jgi:hypothetical protein
MTIRATVLLLALNTLAACAYTPPLQTNRLDIRQVPYTPDSGSIALRCGKLIDGVSGTVQRDALVLIRDGKIRSVKEKSSRNDALLTHVPVLDLTGYTCLPGLIDMHTHLTDRPEDTADLRVYFSRPVEETLRLSKENASAIVKGLTGGYGCDVYIETTGAPVGVNQGLDMIRKLGRFVEFSVFGKDASVDWSIIGDRKELDVRGAHLGPYCYPIAIDLLSRGLVTSKGIVTHDYTLEAWDEAIVMANSLDSIKVLLKPSR